MFEKNNSRYLLSTDLYMSCVVFLWMFQAFFLFSFVFCLWDRGMFPSSKLRADSESVRICSGFAVLIKPLNFLRHLVLAHFFIKSILSRIRFILTAQLIYNQ